MNTRSLPANPPWRSYALFFLAILSVWGLDSLLQKFLNPYIYTVILFAGVNIILAVSLNLITGFTGQFSMGHAGFMSIGAYLSALCSLSFQTQVSAIPFAQEALFLAAIFLGGLGAALAGFVVGLPSLRLQGDYLAIVTLGFGEVIRVILLNIDAIGGARGLPSIPQLSNFAWIYGWVIISCVFIWRLCRTSMGRSFLAVREDEIAAQAMGVNTIRAKMTAFVISSFFAGIAGGLFAHYLSYLNPQSFDFNRSFEIIIMVVLGGLGSLTGSVLSAFLVTILREVLRPLQEITQVDLRMIVFSLLLIILMLTKPHGLLGHKEWNDFRLFKKKAQRLYRKTSVAPKEHQA